MECSSSQSQRRQDPGQMIHVRNENAMALVEDQEAMTTMAHRKPGFEVMSSSRITSFEFKSNTGLKLIELCKEASYFEGYFKGLEASKEMKYETRRNLGYEISIGWNCPETEEWRCGAATLSKWVR
jgi:hypothetical protein